VVVDALLEDRGWLEHHHATRRDRHLGAGLRIAADALALRTTNEPKDDSFTVSPARGSAHFQHEPTNADDSGATGRPSGKPPAKSAQ
jgi:hypothetical protein